MILNYIQFLLSFFDQGVVKSSIVSLNCETLNVPLMYVDNLHLDDFIIDASSAEYNTTRLGLRNPMHFAT